MNNFDDTDLTLVGKEVWLNKVEEKKLLNLLDEKIQSLTTEDKERLEKEVREAEKAHRIRVLEGKLKTRTSNVYFEDWERSGADEALWSRVIYSGLGSLEASPEILPEATKRRLYLALMDAYRLGLIGIENKINKKTADCLTKYQHHKAVNVELRKEIRSLKKRLAKFEVP